MRIIAGKLGGRLFQSPHGHRTHPMSDKARGGLFNVLGDIEGLTVLDAFAGSGALSFEAISRGAASSVAIDNDRNAQRTIAENIRSLKLSAQVKLVSSPAYTWLRGHPELRSGFDLVLLDPPYDNLQTTLLAELADCANRGGIIVISHPPTHTPMLPAHYEQLVKKSYGDAELTFFKKS